MSTAAQVKAAIDAAITNQTAPASVSQTAVGTQMKNVTDFANDNFVPLELTEDTTINTNGFKVRITDGESYFDLHGRNFEVNLTDGINANSRLIQSNESFDLLSTDIPSQDRSFIHIGGDGIYSEFVQSESGGDTTIQADTTGVWIRDNINQLGAYYLADYSVAGKQNPRWLTDWGTIEGYIDGLFNSGVATLVNGQVTVNSALVKTISRQITLNYNSASGALGILAALGTDIIDNTSFVIKSLNPDGTVNTADNSQVRYCIIGD